MLTALPPVPAQPSRPATVTNQMTAPTQSWLLAPPALPYFPSWTWHTGRGILLLHQFTCWINDLWVRPLLCIKSNTLMQISVGSEYAVASSIKAAMGRFWSILIFTSPAVRRSKSKSRRKKKRRRMTTMKKRTRATLTKRRCKAVKKWFLPFSRVRLLTKSKWSRKWMSSGDVTFPGYWLGILRKPSRVRGCCVGLGRSQRHSLGLPSIQEQLDLCLRFPVSFWLRMYLFLFFNFLIYRTELVSLFSTAWYHTIPVRSFLCGFSRFGFFIDRGKCVSFNSQNAGSTIHNPALSLL